jgi:DNA polymerase III delta prime subunit
MVKHSPSVAKICLIHGPPGTGKSKTIVGLLYRLLTEVSVNEDSGAEGWGHGFPSLDLSDM